MSQPTSRHDLALWQLTERGRQPCYFSMWRPLLGAESCDRNGPTAAICVTLNFVVGFTLEDFLLVSVESSFGFCVMFFVYFISVSAFVWFSFGWCPLVFLFVSVWVSNLVFFWLFPSSANFQELPRVQVWPGCDHCGRERVHSIPTEATQTPRSGVCVSHCGQPSKRMVVHN